MCDCRNITRRHWLVGVLAICVATLLGQTTAWAQTASGNPPAAPGSEPSAPAAEAEAPKEAISYKSLFNIVQDGGVMMFPLLGCSFLMLVFVFERVISLRRGRVIPRPFVKRFLHQVREGKLDRDGALETCAEDGSPVSTVFAAAVRKWGRPSVELEQSIIDGCDRVSGTLRRYIRLFNAVSTISPLLGLLGTVFGMIELFNTISNADAMGRTEMLAGGISQALFTTATGLAIAIPALCFYVLFSAKVERLLMEIDGHAQELVGMISAEALHDERHGKMRAKSRPTAAA